MKHCKLHEEYAQISKAEIKQNGKNNKKMELKIRTAPTHCTCLYMTLTTATAQHKMADKRNELVNFI
jgi:hypothetical protein